MALTKREKNPLRRIVGATTVNGIVKDVLECGHTRQRGEEAGTYSRRCYRCRLGYPPDVAGAENERSGDG